MTKIIDGMFVKAARDIILLTSLFKQFLNNEIECLVLYNGLISCNI